MINIYFRVCVRIFNRGKRCEVEIIIIISYKAYFYINSNYSVREHGLID